MRYLVECQEWLRGEKSADPRLEINRRKGKTVEFVFFGREHVPAGYSFTLYPDGQLHTVQGPGGRLELRHGKPAGLLETATYCEEYHSKGTLESWGGLFHHDPSPTDKTFARWVQEALNRVVTG